MVRPVLRELTHLHREFFFREPWFLYRRAGQHWKRAWQDVARRSLETGSGDELHTARGDYRAALLAHLKILDGLHVLAIQLNDFPPPEFGDDLAAVRGELQSHYDSLFPRWQTLDDLEAILLEQFSVPNERLTALAATHAPRQSWYDEPDETPSGEVP